MNSGMLFDEVLESHEFRSSDSQNGHLSIKEQNNR
jgi:hypothetical protein